MLWVVAPVLHTLPVAADEVRITVPASQNVVGPLAVTVGLAGRGVMVVTTADEAAEVQPLLTAETLKLLAVRTLMLWVVAPVLHK